MKNIVLPRLGEGVHEATLISWLKKEGDFVGKEEAVAEIATDKVDSEVLSEHEGYMGELLFKPQDVIPVGSTIARLVDHKEKNAKSQAQDNEKKSETLTQAPSTSEEDRTASVLLSVSSKINAKEKNKQTEANPIAQQKKYNGILSPLVKKILIEHQVDEKELIHINPSGRDGRITKEDLLAYLQRRVELVASTPTKSIDEEILHLNVPHKEAVSVYTTQAMNSIGENSYDAKPMSRLRQMIAVRMRQSLDTSAHVTSFAEADVTNIVEWKVKNAPTAQEKYDTKLSFTPIFLRAILHALLKYPIVNSSITSDFQVIQHKELNIGLAVALPDGNLIVPVIKNALNYNIIGLAKECNRLAKSAKEKTLSPEETKGGTFTVSNIGSFGMLMGTPIINQPEVAVLAIGAIKKRATVIEKPTGDEIAIRHILYLSLSYDHRLIDGMLGGMFLAEITHHLENFDINTPLL